MKAKNLGSEGVYLWGGAVELSGGASTVWSKKKDSTSIAFLMLEMNPIAMKEGKTEWTMPFICKSQHKKYETSDVVPLGFTNEGTPSKKHYQIGRRKNKKKVPL